MSTQNRHSDTLSRPDLRPRLAILAALVIFLAAVLWRVTP
jgi:hypothetical protein